MAVPGREGQDLTYGAGAGKAVGVFTSGGDSQGMKNVNKHDISMFENKHIEDDIEN